MKNLKTKTLPVLLATAFAASLAVSTARADLYKVASIAPGMSPFVVNTAIAKVVSKHVPGVEMQVRATGAATRHIVEAAEGKIDFLFGAQIVNWLLVNQKGPYKNFKNGPELESNIGMIFSYQLGPYHYIVRADSGIVKIEDIKGKRVFTGPPGGAAGVIVRENIKAVTGYEANKDYQEQRFGFDAAFQAFQDDKIDVLIFPSNIPSPAVEQFALTRKIRLLDMDWSKMKINEWMGYTYNKIAADAYGPNQVNSTAVRTHGGNVNFTARMDLPVDVVYKVTKAIWENLDELNQAAKWMQNTISLKTALDTIPSRLHPGAEKYYREIGLKIPTPAVLKIPKK